MKIERDLRTHIWVLATILLSILFVCAIYLIAVIYFMPGWDVRGTFGDTFGAMNALFSGMAFGGIIYTIYLQKKDLNLSIQELSRSAAAQEKSQEALMEQVKSFKLSARLNALRALLEFQTDRAEFGADLRPSQQEALTAAEVLSKRIEALLAEIEMQYQEK